MLAQHVLARAEVEGLTVPAGKRPEVLRAVRRTLAVAIRHERWKNEGGSGVDARTARRMLRRLKDALANVEKRSPNHAGTGPRLAEAHARELRMQWALDPTRRKRRHSRSLLDSSVRTALVTLLGTDATMALLAATRGEARLARGVRDRGDCGLREVPRRGRAAPAKVGRAHRIPWHARSVARRLVRSCGAHPAPAYTPGGGRVGHRKPPHRPYVVEIEIDGKRHTGSYVIEDEIVTVSSALYGSTRTQVGGVRAAVLARSLLRELVEKSRK